MGRFSIGLAVVGSATLAAMVAEGCSASSETANPLDAGAGDGSSEAAEGIDSSPPSDAGDASSGQSCDQDLASDGLYGHLRCAGLYANIATKTVVADAKPYVPSLQLWSDGAAKQRWLVLPAGQKIDTTDMDAWVFPNGTKAWKEFQVGGKRIETRLYLKGADGKWHHTTYRWSDDESDGVRNDTGAVLHLDGPDAAPYQIPSDNECNDCHAGGADRLLGLEAVNLGLAGAQGITLASLVADQLVTVPPPATTLAFPEDSTGHAAAALGWLHVSCGPCHSRAKDASAQNSGVRLFSLATQLFGVDAGADGGPVPVTSLDAYTTTANKATTLDIPDGGGATFFILKPGDPGASLVSFLSGRRVDPSAMPNQSQMPPIVTRVVDTTGHQKLDDWIAALP